MRSVICTFGNTNRKPITPDGVTGFFMRKEICTFIFFSKNGKYLINSPTE